eukprot:7150570-Pyramimonas_sp.AAC.1
MLGGFRVERRRASNERSELTVASVGRPGVSPRPSGVPSGGRDEVGGGEVGGGEGLLALLGIAQLAEVRVAQRLPRGQAVVGVVRQQLADQ